MSSKSVAVLMVLFVASCSSGGSDSNTDLAVSVQVPPGAAAAQGAQGAATDDGAAERQERSDEQALRSTTVTHELIGAESYPCTEQEDADADGGGSWESVVINWMAAEIDWWVTIDPSGFYETRFEDRLVWHETRAVAVDSGVLIAAGSSDSASKTPPTVAHGNYYDALTANLSSGEALLGIRSRVAEIGPHIGESFDHIAIVLIPNANSWVGVLSCGSSYIPAISSALAALGLPSDLEATNNAFLSMIGYPNVDTSNMAPAITNGTLLAALVAAADEEQDPKGTVWIDLNPSTRVLADAPEEFQRSLVPFTMILSLPSKWVGTTDALLCTRVPSGWNSCIGFDLATQTMLDDGFPLLLDGFREPGDEVELMLLEPSTITSGVSRNIGVLAAGMLDSSETLAVEISTEADAGELLNSRQDGVEINAEIWEEPEN